MDALNQMDLFGAKRRPGDRPLHMVPIDRLAQRREHYMTKTCWCMPTASLRDMGTGQQAWQHNNSETGATGPA